VLPIPKRKPKEKLEMTERPIATADSSRLPMCPAKICVVELVPYRQMMLKAMGAPIAHSRRDSSTNSAHAARGDRTAGASRVEPVLAETSAPASSSSSHTATTMSGGGSLGAGPVVAGAMPPGWRGLRLAWGLLVWATPVRATTAGASRALVATSASASSSHIATTMSAASLWAWGCQGKCQDGTGCWCRAGAPCSSWRRVWDGELGVEGCSLPFAFLGVFAFLSLYKT